MNVPVQPSYRVVAFPAERRDMPLINEMNASKHFMYGLLEVDVTCARRYMAACKAQTGESPSFTGFLAWGLARAVAEDKMVQAYRKGRKQLLVFDQVDVGLMVERQAGTRRVLMGYVVRRAEDKSFWTIHQEIRAIQAAPVPAHGGMPPWLRSALLLPWPLSVGVKAVMRTAFNRDPSRFAAMVGTVGVTAVGMFGKGVGGWGITPIIHGLGLIVGSMAAKPCVTGGRIEAREILNLTVVLDHDVIDGAPAARFTRRLVELLESPSGIQEGGPVLPLGWEL
jgi:pyruvate/2-oxoglutarate dehydrogenase complex dihydrolipoamide acyltransferase (E2) component